MVETLSPKPSSRLETPHPIHEIKERPRVRRRLRLPLMLSALLILATLAGTYYYAGTQSYESTDDAFIDGHVIRIAPQIAGRVQRVLVNDNQLVQKGDLVLE